MMSSEACCKYVTNKFNPVFKYVCIFCFTLYYLSYGIVVNLVLVYSSLIMSVLNCVLYTVATAGSLCSFFIIFQFMILTVNKFLQK